MTTTQLLRANGLRKTKARDYVLQLLSRVDRPLSHQEIACEPETRSIDRVTLYRTLTTLRKVGLIHCVHGIDGVWRFRSHQKSVGKCGGNHIHFLCVECNRMSCLPEQPLPRVKEPDGAEIFGKQLVVYGRCRYCNRATEIDRNIQRNSEVGFNQDRDKAESTPLTDKGYER